MTWEAPFQHPDAVVRRSVRVLSMVAELHKAGFQRVRIMPYMSPSGGAWRCAVAPALGFHRNHGALLWEPSVFNDVMDDLARKLMNMAATYSSGSAEQGAYFDWRDAAEDDARTLAAKFIERFPIIAQEGRGWDCAYAG